MANATTTYNVVHDLAGKILSEHDTPELCDQALADYYSENPSAPFDRFIAQVSMPTWAKPVGAVLDELSSIDGDKVDKAESTQSNQTDSSKWADNSVQFARLLAELHMAGGFTSEQEKALCESMDLEPELVTELLERAELEFENIKARSLRDQESHSKMVDEYGQLLQANIKRRGKPMLNLDGSELKESVYLDAMRYAVRVGDRIVLRRHTVQGEVSDVTLIDDDLPLLTGFFGKS